MQMVDTWKREDFKDGGSLQNDDNFKLASSRDVHEIRRILFFFTTPSSLLSLSSVCCPPL